MVVLVIPRKSYVDASVNFVRARHEPFDGVTAVIVAAMHRDVDGVFSRIRFVLSEFNGALVFVPFFQIARFKIIRKEHARIFFDAFIVRILGRDAVCPA